MRITQQDAINVYRSVTHHLLASQLPLWEQEYGPFDRQDYEKWTIQNIPSESSFYHGELVKWMQDYSTETSRILFAGEGEAATGLIKRTTGRQNIWTTGLLQVDFPWDFNKAPPAELGTFDMIVSQAILEHLFDPCKHLGDLIGLLNPDGYLMVHTVAPGFQYHRYPIDALRFYPDWFEQFPRYFPLMVVKRRIKWTHLFYVYRKNGSETGGTQ